YPVLLRPIQTGKAKVVYGSRFLGEHKAMYFWHALGNQSLTLLCNMLFDTTLTDMETCYKVFTIDIARRLRLRESGWGFDPEITARILRMGNRIYEVPISYAGREFNEGKKISWRDGFVVLLTLLRYRFIPSSVPRIAWPRRARGRLRGRARSSADRMQPLLRASTRWPPAGCCSPR